MANLTHASEEMIELYSRNRLDEPALAGFEEHMLQCNTCQDRVAEADSYVYSMKLAARRLQTEAPSFWQQLAGSLNVIPRPALVAAGAFALVALVVVPSRLPVNRQAAQTIELSSSTRAVTGAVEVVSGRPLDLRLNATDLPASSVYTVEIVDRLGELIWESQIRPAGEQLRASVARPLHPGKYWVRVYSDSLKTEQVREFSLQANEGK